MFHEHKPVRSGLVLCLAMAAAGLVMAGDEAIELEMQLAQMDKDLERQMLIPDGPGGLRFVSAEMGNERVVKGAPYCAEAVHETVQWLPDGNGGAANRIVRQQ